MPANSALQPERHLPCLEPVRAGNRLDLAVVLPTYNERENVPLILAELAQHLHGLRWEAIFVDDDSGDGTADVVTACAVETPNVRLIHRVGRRGLASACIEGMMATHAPVIAVMDADLQHDTAILPEMLRRLRRESLDVVVATRNASGGSMGEFERGRVLLSRCGQKISQSICRCELSDPMSGYFLLRREFLMEVVRDLQGEGFKILVDLLASSSRPVRVGEVGYTFAARRHGESKLDLVVGIEYLFMVVNKLLGNALPPRMAMYLMVGGFGLLVHLVTLLTLMRLHHMHFVEAQFFATTLAMVANFFANNRITFRDRQLTGARVLPGLAKFALACSFGAWANVVLSRALLQSNVEWYLAGLSGIVLGSVWNLSVSSVFTWPVRRRSTVSAAPGRFRSAVEAVR
ncbi:glycosyltransferase family 2 protein [Terriglobus roseus]|nr:glycosyltransferase family 2 protein [Terriglobus roseus]